MVSGKQVLRGCTAAAFIAAGVLHFVRPAMYVSIMPTYLPRPLALVYISGVGEILGGVGLLIGRLRRAASLWLVALLIAVFPANIQMAVNGFAGGASLLVRTLLLARLPLQGALVALVLACARPARAPR